MQFIAHVLFTKVSDEHFDESVTARMEEDLGRNPYVGDLIEGSGGARKIRVPMPGRGKRGGARVIYYHDPVRKVVFLLLAYVKNRKTDMDAEDLKSIRELIRKIKTEDYP